MPVSVAHDVVVLGGGPGATAAAIEMARMGLNVGLVERQRFPRPHVGICVPDATVALLKYLGIGSTFAQTGFWRRRLTGVRWDSETRIVPQAGFHLDRGILDQLLLDEARDCGAQIYQPARVEAFNQAFPSTWQLRLSQGGQQLELKARYLIDAAGRRQAIRGARAKDGPPLLALHAAWTLTDPPELDGFIEAGEDAWLWYAQTAANRAVVTVFCDPRRSDMRSGPKDRYFHSLRQFRGLRAETMGHPCSPLRACDATSQHAVDPIGGGYLRVGDSCLAIDPLASQGVHLALQSGLQSAAVVNTILSKPQNTDTAQQFFRARVAERLRRYKSRTRQEYARAASTRSSAFWQERAKDAALDPTSMQRHSAPAMPNSPPAQVSLSPQITSSSAPVIEGKFVEDRRVFQHPNVDGGVAYVEGVELARLITLVPSSILYSSLPDVWSGVAPTHVGSRIAAWMWRTGMLVVAPSNARWGQARPKAAVG